MDTSAASFFLMMIFYLNFYHHENPKVKIPELGLAIGSNMRSTSGRKFQAFRGIPYAEPPVGNLRFRDPVPLISWGDKPLDATKEAPMCMQLDFLTDAIKGQEDCLVLNVYTPSCNFEGDALPVMVWIHGGAFISGSGNGETDLYGPQHLMDRDVVLVTLNYRVGPMGFLSTEDAEAPGNYGLIDQSLALKWVKQNIGYFGGNPESITIFGESAGGASVEFQMMSPYSKDLFHKAIAQSGSTRCSWVLFTDVGKYTSELADQLNCPTSSSQELLECLRSKDGDEILNFRSKLRLPFSLGMFPVAFGPRIDSERESPFLPDDPAALITRKEFNSVPFINGLTENEGALFGSSLATRDGKNLEEFNKDPVKNLQYSMSMENRKDGFEIAQKVYDHYFNNDKQPYEQYGGVLSDIGFNKCVDDSVKALSKYSDHPVYYYYYTHRGQLTLPKAFDQNIRSDIDFGVAHGDELLIMFTNNFIPPMTNPDDIKVKETIFDLWTSFATQGVPQSDRVVGDWKPLVDGQDVRYLNINAQESTLVDGSMPFEPNLDFWNHLLNSSSD